jgi:hypothetical protein
MSSTSALVPRTFFFDSTDRSVPYSAAALLKLSLFPSLDSTDPSKAGVGELPLLGMAL